MIDVAYDIVDSPVGSLLLAATSAGLVRVAFTPCGRDAEPAELAELTALSKAVGPRAVRVPARLSAAARQLDEYFGARRKSFDLPLDLRLTHGFGRSVVEQLWAIPYGTTRTYAQVASATGNPKASRAVGSACGANPLPVVVPCHRVLRSDGALGGYAGGLQIKQALLALEGVPV